MNRNHCIGPCDDIALTLQKIICMQRDAVKEEIRDEFCDISFLDGNEGCHRFNTRPIQVFTKEDKAWSCPVERDEDGCSDGDHVRSCVFRAEKIQRGSVILRVLVEKGHEECVEEHGHEKRKERFKSTSSFINIKLADIAAIRCLPDTFVDICIR